MRNLSATPSPTRVSGLWTRWCLLAVSGVAAIACSGGQPSKLSESSRGSAIASGGALPVGGTEAIAAGGTAAGAHTSGAGGGSQPASSALGGVTSSGGSGSSGGKSGETGGTPALGSSVPTGGTKVTGGTSSTDGTKVTGGTSSTGGAKLTGGSTSTGSSVNSGGTFAAGGTLAIGGSAAMGGSKNTGGVNTVGGTGNNGTAPITVWMAGDSTMQNCTNSACPCGWGSQFDPYFNSNVTVTNSAAGGRSIQTWLYESAVSSTIGPDGECTLTSTTYNSRWTNMLNAMKAGDYLFIAFGINDGDSTCPRHVGTTRFQTLLGVMAQAAKAKGALPILLTPTDAIACSGSTVTENRGFLTETKAAATANSVPLIDLNQLSMTLYASLGFCPNSADYTSTTSALGQFFCDDHTHFEAAGAKQVAGLVANALGTQGIALAAYLL